MSETTASPRRFIAGAVCPACSAMDRIQMWEEQGTPHRYCVACHYSDTLDAQGNAVARELPTRVLKPAAPKDARIQVAQFYPNPKLKKPDDAS